MSSCHSLLLIPGSSLSPAPLNGDEKIAGNTFKYSPKVDGSKKRINEEEEGEEEEEEEEDEEGGEEGDGGSYRVPHTQVSYAAFITLVYSILHQATPHFSSTLERVAAMICNAQYTITLDTSILSLTITHFILSCRITPHHITPPSFLLFTFFFFFFPFCSFLSFCLSLALLSFEYLYSTISSSLHRPLYFLSMSF